MKILETFEYFKNSDAYYDRKPSAEFRGHLIAQQRIEVRTQYGERISTIDVEAIKLLFNQGYVVVFKIKGNARDKHGTEWFKRFDNVEDAKKEFTDFIESEIKKYKGSVA